MSADDTTLRVYAQKAGEYEGMIAAAGDDPALAAFIAALPRGAQVLDLGCGPGHSAAAMAHAGLRVDATDAVAEMVAMTAARPGVRAWQATFDEIAGDDIYDGIWANFSLLHAPKADFPRHLGALRRPLKPGGLFHIGMKTGTGERRDRLGRHYAYYAQAELSAALRAAGFAPFATQTGTDTGLDGSDAPWVTIAAHG